MPAGKGYKMNIKKGGSRTPDSVMGSQGKPAHIKASHYKSKKTGSKAFPG